MSIAGTRQEIEALPLVGLMPYLAERRLLALTLPEALGGLDGRLEDAVQVTFDLARRSGSIGLTYAMHLAQIHTWAVHARGSDHLTAELRDLVASRRLVASVVSEPETGGDIHRSGAVLGEGVLRKETSNTSYVPDAGAFLVTATDTGGRRPVQRLVMVRADQTEAVEKRVNRMMGMGGIHNAAWSFTFRHSPEAVFAQPFSTIAGTTMTPVTHLLWAALWSGLAARALDTAEGFARKELPEAIRPAVLLRHSVLRNSHYLLNALIRDNLTPRDTPFGTEVDLNRLKIEGSQLAQQVVLGCLELVGLRGYATGGPWSLAEVVADVLSAPLMVSNARLQANTVQFDGFSEERP